MFITTSFADEVYNQPPIDIIPIPSIPDINNMTTKDVRDLSISTIVSGMITMASIPIILGGGAVVGTAAGVTLAISGIFASNYIGSAVSTNVYPKVFDGQTPDNNLTILGSYLGTYGVWCLFLFVP